MIDSILRAAGFIENVTYTQAVFKKPPAQPFVVYFDDVDNSQSSDDLRADVREHSVSFEFYAPSVASPQLEVAIEQALKNEGIFYHKTGRTWIQSERYYLTVYNFNYIEKE